MSIVNHFGKQVDDWCSSNPSLAMSQEQVSNIIKSNYESLRLKFQGNLDYYEPYVENPKEISFFRQFIRIMVFDFKTDLQVNPLHIIA
jgi:hypothetical protein